MFRKVTLGLVASLAAINLPIAIAGPAVPIAIRQTAPLNGTDISGSQNQTLSDGILNAPIVFGQPNPDLSNPEASFLFSNPQYYALQRYVYNGMQLAASTEVFENIYNRAEFEQVVGSGSGVYNLTETTFVGINQHCTAFWSNTVGQMTLFAENISIFGRNAAVIYREMARLLDSMAAIPRTERSFDGPWGDNLVDIYNYVERLHDQMGIAKNQSVTLLGNINDFRTETITDMGNLHQVDRLLNDTDSNVYDKISSMNTEIIRLQNEINTAQGEYDEAANKISVGQKAYSWIFPWGTIAYLALSKKWRDEMDAALKEKKAAQDELAQEQELLTEFTRVIDDIQMLQLQTDSVLDYIDAAVGLLSNASDGFASMSASISAILTELESEADDTNPENINPKWFSDASFRMSLNASAANWEDIYVEAAAFKGTASITVISQEAAIQLYDQTAAQIYSAIGTNAGAAISTGSNLLRAIRGSWL
ncbi:hypothetical protein TWF694_004731 [Orbilia ellipsospora]|uniref:Uncharacterized protein n=1 Tax=Orbilia ellipsospora TaxID=2528407 RepID=A0AAV9WVY3_9PEZI